MKIFSTNALMIAFFAAGIANCDEITLQRTNTPDIVIPQFNPNLGDLNSVSLQIQMLSGTTFPGGTHNHGTRLVTSSNTINAFTVFDGFTSITLATNSMSQPSHSFASPTYSGFGVNIGSFIGSTFSSGAHSHSVLVTFDDVIPVGSNQWRIRAREITQSNGSHTHNYPTINKILTYSNPGSIVPFIGFGNIVIPAGQFSTGSSGAHSHTVPSFTRTVQTTMGPQTAFFASEPTNLAGAHNHSLDPRFTVIATFDFSPPLLLGDVNGDGFVNLLDVDPFIDRLSTGTFQAEADINQDGLVNLLDVDPLILLLSGE